MPNKIVLPSEVLERIKRSYADGLSGRAIAKQEGLDQMIVYNALRSAGVEIRSRSESSALRAKKTNHASFRGKSGAFQSFKSGGWIFTASLYEYARAQQLEADESVASFSRCPDFIAYEHGGRQRHYNPDFLVKMCSGHIRVEEVKPSALEGDADVLSKQVAAVAFYGRSGISYRVVTEREIGVDRIAELRSLDLASIAVKTLESERRNRRRAISRESARRMREKNPMTDQQRKDHAAAQLGRYHAFKKTATQEMLQQHRLKVNAQARAYRLRPSIETADA